MSKYIQTGEELLDHLKEQIEFMKASAASYDSGFEGEAKRLAIAIRILVHDTSQSISLLAQLDKRHVLFYDSASVYDPRNMLPSNCLTMMKISKAGSEYVAPLDNLSPSRNKDKKVGFDRWWNRDLMYKDSAANTFTRKDLVLTVANKEGGAHIDPKLDQAYAKLSRFNSLGWKYIVNSKEKPLPSPVPSSIRQIALEVSKTLSDEFPDLCKEVFNAAG